MYDGRVNLDLEIYNAFKAAVLQNIQKIISYIFLNIYSNTYTSC